MKLRPCIVQVHANFCTNKMDVQKQMAPQVTCGGLQSAHTAAVASACAEKGITAHLLVRGERPAVPTGYQPPTQTCSS